MAINQTYQEVLHWASSFLEEHQLDGRASERLLLERLNWNKTDLILAFKTEISTEIKKQLEKDMDALINGEALQHILGYEWFYDRQFRVTKDTLIPRPETEEIIEKFLKMNELEKERLAVLDIGTGSGAIAITVKKERPQDCVTAVDISKKALLVAKENAKLLEAEVLFLEGDLTEPVAKKQFDVVISNPPYISEEEKPLVDEVVLTNEPHLALFAKENGLAIYQRLAKELPPLMKPKGQIIVEIGFKQGKAVAALFQEAFPASHVTIEKDLTGHDRMIFVQLP
ncbi:peptide chain release factor N(5)-glutamine methyltransferase [Carnobacterium divergens]|uniref:peptide chain release factor N(5)-glutamine methyltransferase n=1 Tax=Carnobacterium divergens TaxID=2748 RepID=UPI0035D96A09